MQNYIEKYCEICNTKGVEVYKISFKDFKIKDFFNNFYGIDNTKFLMNLLKIWIILYCVKSVNIYGNLINLSKNLRFNLYEKIIDKDESFEKVKIQKI